MKTHIYVICLTVCCAVSIHAYKTYNTKDDEENDDYYPNKENKYDNYDDNGIYGNNNIYKDKPYGYTDLRAASGDDTYDGSGLNQYGVEPMDGMNAEAQEHFTKLGMKVLNSLITPKKQKMLQGTWKKYMKTNAHLKSVAGKLYKENMDTLKVILKESKDVLGPYSEVMASIIPDFKFGLNEDMVEEYDDEDDDEDDEEEVSWGEKVMQKMDQHMSKYISDYTNWTERCKRFLLEFALYLKYSKVNSRKGLLKSFAMAANKFSPQDQANLAKWIQKVAPSYSRWVMNLKSMCANTIANSAKEFGIEKIQGKIRSTGDLYAAMAYHQCWGFDN